MFSSYFLFYLSDRKSAETRKTHLCKLDKIVFNTSTDSIIAIVISDISIKNQVAIFIAHVHIYDSPIIKTIYYAVNITSTKAELFVIRYRLNQAIQLSNIKYIVVITDSIHAVKKIFDLSIHLYQVQTLIISKEIKVFFERSHHNSIDF